MYRKLMQMSIVENVNCIDSAAIRKQFNNHRKLIDDEKQNSNVIFI